MCTAVFLFLFFLFLLYGLFSMFIITPEFLLNPPAPSPEFTLLGVKLYAFNLSTTTSTLTSTFQIDISFRNSRRDLAFHFRQLEVYASYRKQQITLPTTIPPSYLGSPGFTIWSLYLNGTEVPLSPDLAMFLAEDETSGTVLINVEVTGRSRLIRYFTIFIRRLKVNCPRYIMLVGNKNASDVVGLAVNNPVVGRCPVEAT